MCESVSARTLALPFFGAITEAEQHTVAQELRGGRGGIVALVAAVPHPVQVVRSTTAYLLAPAPLDDGVAYLTVPRALGGPGGRGAHLGRSPGRAAHSGVRTLFDYGCEVAVECNAVRAPVGDGTDVVYGVPGEDGGGYIARAGVDGRSRLVAGDETSSGAVLSYTAAAGMTVYASKGAHRRPRRHRRRP